MFQINQDEKNNVMKRNCWDNVISRFASIFSARQWPATHVFLERKEKRSMQYPFPPDRRKNSWYWHHQSCLLVLGNLANRNWFSMTSLKNSIHVYLNMWWNISTIFSIKHSSIKLLDTKTLHPLLKTSKVKGFINKICNRSWKITNSWWL